MMPATRVVAPKAEDVAFVERLYAKGMLPDDGVDHRARDVEPRLDTVLQNVQTSSALLAREFAPMGWLVEGMIPAEGLTVLGAKMGLGKSYFLLQLAAALSTGTSFFGREVKRQGVALIALEDSDRRIHDRLNQLGAIGTDRLLIATRWSRGTKALEDLRLLLQCREWVRVVIVDPIVKLVEGCDFNAYDAAYGALGPLKDLFTTRRVAGVFAHHCKKSVAELDAFDDIMGSTGWGAAADTRLVLRRQRGSDEATLIVGGRDVAHSESALRFSPAAGWTYEGSADEVRMSAERREIVELLVREGPLSGTEIAKILDKNPSTTRNLLSKMIEAGEVAKDVDGRWICHRRVDTVDAHAVNGLRNEPSSTASIPSTPPIPPTSSTDERGISTSPLLFPEAARA